jgi:alkylation response protein AidB-like acyl-CoA dehydrogenase
MADVIYDRRDIKFALFDQFKVGKFAEYKAFSDYDEATFMEVLDSAFKFATEKLGPTNAEGDKVGVKIVDGQAILPQSFEKLYKEFCESGYLSVSRNTDFGGMGMPHLMAFGLTELFIAANPSFMFTPGLTDAAAHLIEAFGTDADRAMYVEKMYTGKWSGTMCLTEPAAGSAVGDLSTKAEVVEGQEYYKITGNKIFISSGDHQLAENIVHLVLARVPGDPAGTKGISLFIVPKFRPTADGKVGERNDVTLAGIEHKMGIHASATCSLSFGDAGECQGWLVGERCKGIVYMFQMMNEARLACGVQGAAMGNAAYQLALAYARERKQGPKVTDRTSDPVSVPIIEHPDVRRNLMTMKAYGEAIRAIIFRVAAMTDIAHHSPDAAERAKAADLVDLLTPVAKAFPTDMGFKMTELAIQIHGGYGYIKEYGVEQHMRDLKIASLYEGTNGIQALDLLGRKMRQKGGGLFIQWLQDANELIGPLTENPVFADNAKRLDAAKNALAEAAFSFSSSKDPEYPLLHATNFLRMFGLVESARLLLEQSTLAYAKLEPIWAARGVDATDAAARKQLAEDQEDVRFYEGKIATSTFFAAQLLPEVRALLVSLQSNDRSALDVVL